MSDEENGRFDCVCQLCGEHFKGIRPTVKYCRNEHYRECVACGKRFKLRSNYSVATTCSKKCAASIIDFDKRSEGYKATLAERYGEGVVNASQLDFVKEKKATLMEHYGVENPSHSPEILAKKYRAPQNTTKVAKEAKSNKEAPLSDGKTRRVSKINVAWKKRLDSLFGVDFSFEVPFGKHFYADLGFGDLLLDLNPSISHNATAPYLHLTGRCSRFRRGEACDCEVKPEDEDHQRAVQALDNGKVLLQLFDWMDKDVFISTVGRALGVGRTVNENALIVKDNDSVRSFFAEYSFSQPSEEDVVLSLYDGDERVASESFAHKGDDVWEVSARAIKGGLLVDFTKVEEYFVRVYQPTELTFTCDLASFVPSDLCGRWVRKSVNGPTSRRVKHGAEGYLEVFGAGSLTFGWA